MLYSNDHTARSDAHYPAARPSGTARAAGWPKGFTYIFSIIAPAQLDGSVPVKRSSEQSRRASLGRELGTSGGRLPVNALVPSSNDCRDGNAPELNQVDGRLPVSPQPVSTLQHASSSRGEDRVGGEGIT